MGDVTLFTNGTILTPIREIPGGAVVIENGLIKDFGLAAEIDHHEATRVIDLQGAYLSPGFIDLHLHGAWGGDVMAASRRDLEFMSSGLIKGGVTAFLPTTLSGSLAEIANAAACIDRAMKEPLPGAKIIGAHLEGPYFNMKQKGAQNPRYIINPKPEDYLPIFESYSCIKRVSAAPEIPGGLELGQELKRRGIVASIAHSNATYQEVLQAVENGYTHATHIFSGMSGIQRVEAYRVTGLIESVLLLDELTTEMIADGHHLPPSLMRLVLKTKGIDRVCLVTDSMVAAGLGPGSYQLGGLDIIIESCIPPAFEIPAQDKNYVAKLADRSAFASSVATMDQLVRNAVKFVGLSVLDAIKLVTVNPARFQGQDAAFGIIAKGRAADLTLFDRDINIQATWVDGKVVYQKEGLKFS